MRRFRKRVNVKNDRRPVFPVALALCAVVSVFFALSYLWINDRCETVAGTIKQLERERDELVVRVRNEEAKWSRLHTLRRVREQLVAFGIAMDYPANDRVVRLRLPADAAPSTPAPVAAPQVARAGAPRSFHE
jgi:hypothetical protein